MTFTATANQSAGETGGAYLLRIFDETAGYVLNTCSSSTCSYTSTSLFTSGAPHQYVAEVSSGDYYIPYGTTTDIQATSNVVTETRGEWTVSLTSDKTTFAAGEEVTLTATANQNVGSTGGAYYIRIFDQTAGTLVYVCTSGATCVDTTTWLFYAGPPHTYFAEVSAGDYYAAPGSTTDIQATSNTVTLTRAAWAITLSTTETTYSTGSTPVLTAVANQSIADSAYDYSIYIYDETAGEVVRTCDYWSRATTSCSVPWAATSGPPHTFIAYVASADDRTVDVQATSGEVTETRAPWTVSLSIDLPVYTTTDAPRLTGVANQSLYATGLTYTIYYFDADTGEQAGYCYEPEGSSCSQVVGSMGGGPVHYEAVVALTGQGGVSLAEMNDIEATSNIVTATRAPWTVTLSMGPEVPSPTYPTEYSFELNAVANQYANESYYSIAIVDWTTGQVIKDCTFSYSCYINVGADTSSAPQTYVAIVANVAWLGWAYSDVQAMSASVTNVSPAVTVSEFIGGSNASENSCPCSHGDPVNTATGEFYTSSTDDGIPGAGPAVSIGRTYSSINSVADGPFGHGWTASFSPALTVLTAGDANDPLPRQVEVTQENGAVVEFNENADQSYSAPARVLATLSHDPTTNLWTFTRQERQVFVFDATGALTESKDLNGNTVVYGYTSGQVTSITGSGGRWIDLTWTSGHVTGTTDSAGRSVAYTYNGSDELTMVTAVDSSETSYGYDGNYLLTTITKPDGGVTTNTYDTSDRVTSQTDPVGRVTTFDYSGDTTYTIAPDSSVTEEVYTNGLLTSQTRAAGETYAETTTYVYDSANNVASMTDPLGKVTSYTYDALGDVLTETDPLDRTTTSTYDSLGDVLTVTDPLSREAIATYDSAGNKLSATSPSGRVEHWTYNANGTVATAADARGKITTYGYNTAGDATSATDPDGRTTTTAYNSAGIVTSTTDAGSNTTSYTTDAAGRMLTATDPNSHTTTYTYDGDGNKTAVENAGGHTTTYVYDDADQLTSSTVPGSHTTSYTYTYTDAGLPETVTDPNGHTSSVSYDALGLKTSSTNADGKTTHFGYDGDGRQTSETLPSGAETTVTYDDAGQKTSSMDALGKATNYAYDVDGELTSTTDPLSRVSGASYTPDGQVHVITLPDSSTETSTYNADGQLTDFENADGAHTTYAYDDAGLLTSKTEPGSITTAYTYTTAGRLYTTTNPDATTVTDSYNPGGLLTGVAYSSSSAADVSYTYDADDLRTGMTDATGSSSYSYDSRGLMTSETNGAGATIGYGYDGASQLTTITYPGSKTVTYGYDDAGQMTSLTDWASNETDFAWTDNGQLQTQADPNGVTQTRTYDADGRTIDIGTSNSNTTLADYGYGYDADGVLTSDSTVDPNHSAAVNHTYGYTALTQLASINDGTSTSSYTNTPAGEVTANTAGSTLAYNTAQELTSLTPGSGPSTSYTYDGNGSRTSATVAATGTTAASTTSFAYDPAGDLASVGVPATGTTAAQTIDYASDGDGLRQSRTVGTTTRDFLWDTNGSLPLLLDDGTSSYIYGPSSAPVAQVSDSTATVQYLTSDLIGSTRLITSSAALVVGDSTYGEYGTATSHTGAASSDIGYSGNWTDPATGLVYLRARDYDPFVAQFLTVDPLVDSTRQPYAYVAGDPLDQTDPTGACAAADFRRAVQWFGFYVQSYFQDLGPEYWESLTAFSDGIQIGLPFTDPSNRDIRNYGSDPGFWIEFGLGALVSAATVVIAAKQLAEEVFTEPEPAAGVTAPEVSTQISVQRQARHLLGPSYTGGGYFNSESDAQAVLDAYHSGRASVLNVKPNGNIVVKYNGVTGYNSNPSAGYSGQPTHVFTIKGTKSVSIFPTSPGGSK